jgi:hypothetical protein
MDTTYIYIAVVVILVIMGIILAPIFSRRKRSQNFQDKFGAEYDRTVESAGGEKQAQAELNERQKHVDTLNIRPLSVEERERYLTTWAAVQGKFVDEPGEATVEANHLVTEVMELRDYPVSDFDQRAADISINYPDLVSNYRAAREIRIKHEQHKASTEELRHALIYYRSLFSELLGAETVEPESKRAPRSEAKTAPKDKKVIPAETVAPKENVVLATEPVAPKEAMVIEEEAVETEPTKG